MDIEREKETECKELKTKWKLKKKPTRSGKENRLENETKWA